ncbi:hypothetical protein AAG94_22015 [Escherichia albertii]|nr:hypothetical protein [Escherichia albertii]EFO4721113.1 hypothetical protein [Escherichia albertii]
MQLFGFHVTLVCFSLRVIDFYTVTGCFLYPRYFIRTPYNGVLASQTRHDYCPQSSMIRGALVTANRGQVALLPGPSVTWMPVPAPRGYQVNPYTRETE